MLFIIKPTSACNGACLYCSAHQEDPEARGRMSLPQLDRILLRIEEWGLQAKPDRLALLWHGGEPLLMGAAFYREVLRRTRELRERTGLELRHIMQSNLTLVDAEL
ncbi:MAG: radical SAM protein, partial [bacterium]